MDTDSIAIASWIREMRYLESIVAARRLGPLPIVSLFSGDRDPRNGDLKLGT